MLLENKKNNENLINMGNLLIENKLLFVLR